MATPLQIARSTRPEVCQLTRRSPAPLLLLLRSLRRSGRQSIRVPRAPLEARVAQVYPRPGRGQRPYPLGLMLRVHCVQLYWACSL